MRERSVAVGATIDEALEMLSDTGPEWGYGELQALSNHGPMGAEALCALGRDEAVVPWVERYKRRLQDTLSRAIQSLARSGARRSAMADALETGSPSST